MGPDEEQEFKGYLWEGYLELETFANLYEVEKLKELSIEEATQRIWKSISFLQKLVQWIEITRNLAEECKSRSDKEFDENATFCIAFSGDTLSCRASVDKFKEFFGTDDDCGFSDETDPIEVLSILKSWQERELKKLQEIKEIFFKRRKRYIQDEV